MEVNREMGDMDASENIETEVITGNNMLTLITTEDGIPNSTEVTVLTTALDVPIMTASLGSLSSVPRVTHHPTIVSSHAGVRTLYTTSLVPSHAGQAVVLGDGQIAVMGPDGVRQTIVVHTTDHHTRVEQNDESQSHNVITVNLPDASEVEADLSTAVVLTEEEAAALSQEEVLTTVEEIPTEIVDAGMVNAVVQENVIIEVPKVHNVASVSTPSAIAVISSEAQQHHIEISVAPEKGEAKLELTKEESINNAAIIPKNERDKESPVLQIPDKIICLVCYEAFPNPKRRKDDFILEEGDKIKGDDSPTELLHCNLRRTLGKFFELSRINMSIVTRRSFKDYEVPICAMCDEKLVQAENILEELKKLEKKLYFLRQEIKEKIQESHSLFNKEEKKEVLETRRKVQGLSEMLTAVDHIREDIINDGRPPKIPRSMSGGKKGRKPKKVIHESSIIPPIVIEGKPTSVADSKPSAIPSLEIPITSSTITSQSTDPLEPETITGFQTTESNTLTTSPNAEEEEKDEKPAIRTSFGRLIKRPAYMLNELTEDELSELGESSEDNYEEIEVKPAILEEGEPGVVNEDDGDEEDPAWCPERGFIISEKVGIPPSSSEGSEYLSEESDIDSVPKTKVKKDVRVKKLKKTRSKSGPKKPKQKRVSASRAEDVNYEVKVIQLDGTELMTINTTGDSNGIGLEPDITQKVMDSQAVIMVKNQLFGKRVQCLHCPRTFTDPARRDVHVKRKHEGVSKPFDCDVCQKRFGRQDHLRNHMKRHTRPPKEKCSVKPRSSTSEKSQSCEFCDQRFRNKSELLIHTRLHTGEKPFKCECGEAFVSALKKEFHIEQMHPEIPPLRCEFCPKAFFRQHRLRIHAVSHTGEKTNICEICGKSFSQAAMLRYHQTTHEELNLKQFKCQECNRVFANPQNLKSHMESQHQKMYRHRCETCGRGYTQMSHLRRHLRTHSGEQPYVCSFCPKKFTSGAALKIHVRIHTGERPYWCSQCEKGFRSKTKLGRHLKTLIHSGEKDKTKKEPTEIETVDVNAGSSTTWTEIVGIITGV